MSAEREMRHLPLSPETIICTKDNIIRIIECTICNSRDILPPWRHTGVLLYEQSDHQARLFFKGFENELFDVGRSDLYLALGPFDENLPLRYFQSNFKFLTIRCLLGWWWCLAQRRWAYYLKPYGFVLLGFQNIDYRRIFQLFSWASKMRLVIVSMFFRLFNTLVVTSIMSSPSISLRMKDLG